MPSAQDSFRLRRKHHECVNCRPPAQARSAIRQGTLSPEVLGVILGLYRIYIGALLG